MDFFERQDQARRRTRWLVLYFTLSVISTIALLYLGFAFIFLRDHLQAEGLRGLWNLQLFAGVTAGTLFVVLVGNIYKISQLSQGGSAVARLLGGRPIASATHDPDERKLINVVEEMAIASGTPIPELYLLDDEKGVNAFAAGTTPKDAAIGVTRGCVQLLSRDELQGVIAHEFSHILNGDMRLNLRLIGIIHGLICLAIIGRILLRASSRGYYGRSRYSLGARSGGGKGGSNPLPLIGLILLVIGSIGVFFGRLLKSAVSRQREFLADAAAVQFTRNPQGLAGALKKIGGLVYGSKLQTPRAEEASHLFFGNGLRTSWFKGFSTHPPLEERIRAIDSSWDGKFPRVDFDQGGIPEESMPRTARRPNPTVIPPPQLHDLLGGQAPRTKPPPPVIQAEHVMSQMGQPTTNHLDFAVQLLAGIPATIADAVHDPIQAQSLIYCFLLSRDPQIRAQQQQECCAPLSPEIRQGMDKLSKTVAALEPRYVLPVAELTLPALRQLSQADYLQFANTTRQLIASDQEIDLYEYALQSLIIRQLDPHFHPAHRRVIQYYSLTPLLPECQVLLSALAHLGSTGPENKRSAFHHGAASLGSAKNPLTMLPLSECGLGPIDSALDRLNEASGPIKKRLLESCLATISFDGVVQLKEAELLRAIAHSLDCPLPPLNVTRT